VIATTRARGLLFVVLGIALTGVGGYHWHLVLASSADVGRTYLARTVAPIIAGVWSVIVGVYWSGGA
jgi:hypothetical protein